MVPGYMSRAPHSYGTDRLCLVLSGTWWVNSGADFDPNDTVPASAGGFVRRVANTPHYDGVKQGATESAVIGIFGLAPVDLKLVYAPSNTLCVSEDLWRRFCKMGCISNGDPDPVKKDAADRMAFKRAAQRLLDGGHIGKHNEWVWIAR